MSNRQILTKERLATIPALVEQGLGRDQIAELLGCSPGTLAVKCSINKISLRRDKRPRRQPSLAPLMLSRAVVIDLNKHAGVRGCTPAKLVSDLLEMIVADNLYVAVLGETDTASLPGLAGSQIHLPGGSTVGQTAPA